MQEIIISIQNYFLHDRQFCEDAYTEKVLSSIDVICERD
jgi:endonuclease III-like uncharacterized protein